MRMFLVVSVELFVSRTLDIYYDISDLFKYINIKNMKGLKNTAQLLSNKVGNLKKKF